MRYIEKVAKLGFDILEIAATPIPGYSDKDMAELKACAAANGVMLTAGHGPNASQNLASADPAVRAHAKAFFIDLLKRLGKWDIHTIGGALYSYWPVDYTKPIDKKGELGPQRGKCARSGQGGSRLWCCLLPRSAQPF